MKGAVSKERLSLNLAKIKKGGENFEIIVNPDMLSSYLSGEENDVKEVLQYEKIFFDAKKGYEASTEHIQSIFGETDVLEIAKIILREGEVQYTKEYRDKKREEKRNRLVDFIVRNAVDPKTGLPHPKVRIESALEEAKYRLDEKKDIEEQIKEAIRSLQPILPIKIETKYFDVVIPASYAGKAYSVLNKHGKIIEEKWLENGDWKCLTEIPAGLQNIFFDDINSFTHGEANIVLKDKR